MSDMREIINTINDAATRGVPIAITLSGRDVDEPLIGTPQNKVTGTETEVAFTIIEQKTQKRIPIKWIQVIDVKLA